MKNIVIIGISDTAGRVIQFIERYNLFNILGCSVSKEYLPKHNEILLGGGKRKVCALEQLHEYIDIDNDLVFVAIFWNRLNADRRYLYEKVKAMGFRFANVISPNCSLRSRSIGENCWICDYVIAEEESVIGNNCSIQDGAFIGDWAHLEDHVFMAARSSVYGSTLIGEQSFVGINANVFDEVHIGKKCMIGACTIVKRNVPDFTVVKTINDGNVIKQYPEEVIESKWLAHHNTR